MALKSLSVLVSERNVARSEVAYVEMPFTSAGGGMLPPAMAIDCAQ